MRHPVELYRIIYINSIQ